MMYSTRTATHCALVSNDLQSPGTRRFSLRRLPWRAIEAFCAGVIVITLFGPAHAEDSPVPADTPSLPAAETLAQTPDAVDPVTADPFIQLHGSVWRTKSGIVFLKTPVGQLTLTSKTTLKDLKASQEVRFWVHERHSVVEIRKRTDGSLVHRYYSGPMTSGTDAPKTLRCWGPDGEQIVHIGTQEERLADYQEGDQLTIEVDDTNTISGVHDLEFDLQINQIPPVGADVRILLSGTVSKLKSSFVFIRTPIGLIMLNSKIGVPRVKVGQPLIVDVDHEHVTVTIPSTETPTPQRSASPTP